MSEVEELRAELDSRDAQLTRQNAGLVQMARERDAALAELSAMRNAAFDFTRVDPHGWARIRELESERDFLRRIATNRARELQDVWRMVGSEPIADDDVPMVIMAVRMMRERHDSFKASTERLSAETVELRAELAETTDERNAAWRALHEILGKCVEGLGDSASVIVESVAVNLLRDEVKRLKEKA